MELKELKPKKALNKAFLKVKPNRSDIEGFKTNLIALLDSTNDTESEEFHKNLVIDFLKKTYYDPNHFVNTKGRNDLVIHNGNSAKSTVGVIIETKKPTNKTEMISTKKINAKAFQELVLYYLRERITHKNLEVKYLVATNINEWFIFDATLFDRLFAQNKNLVKQFNDFEGGRLADTKTDFFYKQIAEPFIDTIKVEIEFTYFNIQDYQKALRNADKADDNSLISLFKLLSPEHLLKLPFTNDSNSLDKRFYSELLHIIGLTETKEGSKKLIERNKEGERNSGSILEDTIIQLDSLDKINRLEKPSQFGNTQQERLFNVGLELSITWINRILFLKLLEAQLLTYHKGDKSYAFLSLDKIKNYDDLNSLFFQVLARKYDERNQDVKKAFEKVPYLNSSLFEPTEIEQVTLFISNLKDDKTIPVISSTVLKNEQGKKRTGSINTLEYLFEFLNAYDFTSEGAEEIQEDNKSLINASVLGLIFEKINGYKDGSFFTPGFITMYMCKETIRKAVVQKFNETKKWSCTSIEELYDKIEDRKEANEIVNSIKICDPAVGSGHFLVSALNEMIAVKNDLKILQDRTGKRLKEYHVEVVNDELIVTDEEGELFDYNPTNKESQRIQETLFHEKQTIIENCLFGVDINPNSVKICRLRLWIELLKNAYYKNKTELETLPNIDINIKCGNSLVSRFAIDADLKQALKKSKWTIDTYRIAVDTYRNAESKEQKREMERLIADIKSDFRSEIDTPFKKTIRTARGKVDKLATEINTQKQWGEKTNKKLIKEYEEAVEKLKKLEAEKDDILQNKIFENAFEWRFEFPEVLSDDGDFVGFDVVIGNPPYLNVELMEKRDKEYFKKVFTTFYKRSDIFNLFIELGTFSLTRKGIVNFIIPSIVLNNLSYKPIREHLLKNNFLSRVFYTGGNIFEEATVDTVILFVDKKTVKSIELIDALNFNQPRTTIVENEFFEKFDYTISVSGDENSNKVFDKIFKSTNINVEQHFEVFQGIVTGNNPVYIFDQPEQWKSVEIESELLKPLLHGRDFNKWIIKNAERRILYLTQDIEINNYSKALSYLNNFKGDLENSRSSNEKTTDWWCLHRPRVKDNLDFTPKIIIQNTRNERLKPRIVATVDEVGYYGSQGMNFVVPKTKEYSVYFLIGIINSTLVNYLFATKFLNLAIKADYIKQISFPKPSEITVNEIETISKEILNLKSKDLKADTKNLEKKLDFAVYHLYQLTEEEIEIIETV
jgi:adenine-specific DNA-methyltransferase